eukprot:TRINITY_DN1289_c1_g1_i9.p4 TRINITY_DN1289_c1_g1~~TRINITY_DN1289_c1_g1_i9.p4  ORF type:complete len:197 (-),score=-16.61 TRINITY_DN1289_c1_g1_i9:927-1517(-)
MLPDGNTESTISKPICYNINIHRTINTAQKNIYPGKGLQCTYNYLCLLSTYEYFDDPYIYTNKYEKIPKEQYFFTKVTRIRKKLTRSQNLYTQEMISSPTTNTSYTFVCIKIQENLGQKIRIVMCLDYSNRSAQNHYKMHIFDIPCNEIQVNIGCGLTKENAMKSEHTFLRLESKPHTVTQKTIRYYYQQQQQQIF